MHEPHDDEREAETAQTIDVDKINEVGSQPVLNDSKLTDDQRCLLKSGMLDLLSVADVHKPDPFEEMRSPGLVRR